LNNVLSKLVERGYIKEIKAKNTEGTPYYIPLPPQIKITEDISLRLQKELTALSDDVKGDWNKTIQSFRTQLAAFHDKITENTDFHSKELSESSKQFLETISSIVTASKEEITEIVNKLISDAGVISKSQEEQLANSITRITENLSSVFDTTIHKIGEYHDSFKEKINETFSQLEQEHQTRVQEQLMGILDNVEKVKTSISELKDNFIENIVSKKNIVSQITDSSISSLSSKAKVLYSESKDKAKETIEKITGNFLTEVENYQLKINEILNTLNEELKKLEDVTTNRIKTAIEKSKQTAVNVLINNKDEFIDLLNKTKELSVKKLSEVISQTEANSQDMKIELGENLNSYLKDFEKNSDSLLKLLKEGIDNGFKQFETNLSNSIDNVSNQIKLFINEILDNVIEMKDEVANELSNNYNEFQSLANTQKEKLAVQIQELNTFISLTLQETLKQGETKIKDVKKEIQKSATSSIKKVTEKETKAIETLETESQKKKEEISSILTETVSELKSSIDSSCTELEQFVTTYTTEMSNRKQEFESKNQEYSDSVISNLQDMKGSVIAEIEENVKENTSAVTDLLSQKEKKLRADLELFADEFAKRGRDIRDEVPNLVQINYQASLERVNELSDQLKLAINKIEDIVQNFQGLNEKQLQKVFGKEEGPRVAQLIGEITADINSLKSSSSSKIEEVKNTFSDSMSNLSNDIFVRMNQKLDELSSFTQGYLTDLNKSFDESKTMIEEGFSTSLSNMKNKILETYEEQENSFNEIQKTNVKGLLEIIGREVEDIAKVKENFDEYSSGFFTRVSELLDESLLENIYDNYQNVFQTNTKSFVKDIIDVLEKEQSKTAGSYDSIIKSLAQVEKDLSKKIDKTFKDLEKVNKTIHDKPLADLSVAITRSQEFLDNLVKMNQPTENVEGEENEQEQKKSQMYVHIENGLEELQNSKNGILDLMKNNNEEVLKNLHSTLQTSITEHSKLVKSLTNAIDENMAKLQTEFDQAKNTLDSEVAVTLDEAADNYEKQTENVSGEISKLIDSEIQQFLESSKSLLSELNISPDRDSLLGEIINTTKENFEQVSVNYPRWIIEDNEKYSNEMNSIIADFQNETQAVVNDLYTDVKKDLETIYDKVSNQLANDSTKIQEVFEREKNDYQLNVSHQINSLTTNSDSNSSTLVTNIQGTKANLIETASSVQNTLGSELANFENTTKDLFNNFLSKTIEKLEQTLGESKAIENLKQEYVGKLQGFKEDFIKDTQKEVEVVDTDITGMLKSIPSKIDVVLEATGESMNLLKNVLSLGKGIEPNPIEDIWVVSGKEQVASSMMALLYHTKSSATVVTPRLNWVSIDFLDSFTRKMEIVTNTQEHNEEDKKVLNKMLEMGNITVKDAPGLTVMMGTRDGIEEGFLGHVTMSGEPVLVVTLNEEMVKEITKIYYDYRSRAPLRS